MAPSSRRQTRISPLRRVAGLVWLVAFVSPSVAGAAEPRASADLEFMTVRWDSGGSMRDTVFTVGGTLGLRAGQVVPYVGAGLGFFTAAARAGVALYPTDLHDSGMMIRLEARPEILTFACWQKAVLGQIAAGYRWSLEYRGQEEEPGAGFYLLPALEAGPAWIRHRCGAAGADPSYDGTFLYGATLSAGWEW